MRSRSKIVKSFVSVILFAAVSCNICAGPTRYEFFPDARKFKPSKESTVPSPPGGDRLLGYDLSALGLNYFSIGAGLTLSGTDLTADGSAHNILSHADTTFDSAIRGDILYGFANGDWRRLAVGAALGGAATTYFGGDGADVGYRTLAQMLNDLSGEATGSFDWNNQGITNVKLGSLTDNGFVKTEGGVGTLSVDTNTYVETPVLIGPASILFGSTGNEQTQDYDIDGETWVTSGDGTCDQADHLEPACLAAMSTSYDDSFFSIREGSGASVGDFFPLTVEFTFTGVTTFAQVKLRDMYDGSASHFLRVELFNGVTWDVIGTQSASAAYEIHSYEVLNPVDYIDAEVVKMRFRHVTNGISSHHLEVDYLVLSTGAGGGGGGVQTAIQTTSTATGDIGSTNVQGAIEELEAEKIPHSLADAANDFLVASGNDVFVKKTLAETGAILEGDIVHDNLQSVHQDVTSGSAPTFTADNFSDGGSNAIITTSQETNFEAAFTHVSNDGSNHSLLTATPGTAEASKALVVDSNLDIDTIRNLGITGDFIATGDIKGSLLTVDTVGNVQGPHVLFNSRLSNGGADNTLDLRRDVRTVGVDGLIVTGDGVAIRARARDDTRVSNVASIQMFSESGSANRDGCFKILTANNNVLTLGLTIDSDQKVTLEGDLAVKGEVAFYQGAPVPQASALTSQLTTITHTGPSTPDYAIAAPTDTNAWGFSSDNEFETIMSVIRNLQIRVQELESALDENNGVGLIAN